MHSLLNTIKQAAVEAVEASNPTRILFGTVVATSPLSIKISQKITIPSEFLILTRNVTDYETELEANEVLQTYTVKNSLNSGDKVIMVQMQGGQKYIVLDKVGD